jgi:hypothetical protein
MPAPSADVAAHLVAGSPLAGVVLTAANCFGGPLPAATGVPAGTSGVPSLAIGCVQTGGANTPFIGGAAKKVHEPLVNVHVRSGGDGYTSGLALAEAAKERCNLQAPAGYIGWWASEVTYMGPDEVGAHHWTFNVRTTWAD